MRQAPVVEEGDLMVLLVRAATDEGGRPAGIVGSAGTLSTTVIPRLARGLALAAILHTDAMT